MQRNKREVLTNERAVTTKWHVATRLIQFAYEGAESLATVACFLARYRSRAADTDVSVLRRAIFFGLAGSGSGGAGGGGRGGGEGEGVLWTSRWGSSSSSLVEFRSLSSSLPWSLFDLSGNLSSGGGGSCGLFFSAALDSLTSSVRFSFSVSFLSSAPWTLYAPLETFCCRRL